MEKKPEFLILVFEDEDAWDVAISFEKARNPRRRAAEYMILKEHMDAALEKIQDLREGAGM